MNPQFLHLEDEKTNIFLESLLIDGEDTNDIDPVLSEIFSYYSGLHSNQDIKTREDITTFLNNILSLPKVVQETDSMIGDIMELEVEQAIKQLKLGKSPGSDGLTSSF